MNTCKKCKIDFLEWKVTVKIFKNGTKHLEARCPFCNWFFKYLPQNKDFELWFGKYKGKKISELIIEDRDYLQWLIENSDERISKKIQSVIAKITEKT